MVLTPPSSPISKPPVTVDVGQNDSRDGRQDNGAYTVPLKVQWTAPDVGIVSPSEFVTDGDTLVGWGADYRDTLTTYAGWDLKTGKLKWGAGHALRLHVSLNGRWLRHTHRRTRPCRS